MSRSKRRSKPKKCMCGRHEIRYLGTNDYACTVLGYTHEWNEQYLKFKRKKTEDVRQNY